MRRTGPTSEYITCCFEERSKKSPAECIRENSESNYPGEVNLQISIKKFSRDRKFQWDDIAKYHPAVTSRVAAVPGIGIFLPELGERES